MASPTSFLKDPSILLTGLALGRVGVWRWRIGSDDLEWSDNLPAIRALPDTSFDGSLANFHNDVHPDDADALLVTIRSAIEKQGSYEAIYRTAPRPDGQTVYLETRGAVTLGDDGERYLTGICMNVTERTENERRLKRQVAQQQAIARFGRLALEEKHLPTVIAEAVRIARDALDVPLTKILAFSDSGENLLLQAGCGWPDGIVGRASVGIERESQAGFTLLENDLIVVEDMDREDRFNGPELLIANGVKSGMSVPIAGSGKRPYGVFGIHATEPRRFEASDREFLVTLANIVASSVRQRDAERQSALLLREMAHRAGNMMQMVSAIASQTFVENRSLAEARNAFTERLASLSRANYLIARGGWRATRFKELVEETLTPFERRFQFSGRDILLPPELSFDFGLILHELATNSVKYGTLGLERGQVALAWQLGAGSAEDTEAASGEQFVFSWHDPIESEKAGTMPHTGFGNRMFTALIEKKWDGKLTVDHDQGYRFSCSIPVLDRH